MIATIRQRVKGIENVVISAHCHNDLGMAVANALAAVAAGARQVECTINGIGERAGNASLEEIVMAMRVRPDRFPYETGVVSEQIFAASQTLSEITGVPVQPNKAITGRNAFAHEAGIHQDGVLKNPLTYEIMTPKSVGVPDSKLVLGKHSGRHALGLRCEQLGYQFDRRALDDIYRRFVRLADKIKHVEDHHLLELIRDTHKPSGSATPLIQADRALQKGGYVRRMCQRYSPRPLRLLKRSNPFPRRRRRTRLERRCRFMLTHTTSKRSRKTIFGEVRKIGYSADILLSY